MFETDRNQPIRVCALASGFSMRMFGIANGTLMTPVPSPKGASFFASALNVGDDGRRHTAMQPGDRLALAIDAGLEMLDRHRVVSARLRIREIGRARPLSPPHERRGGETSPCAACIQYRRAWREIWVLPGVSPGSATAVFPSITVRGALAPHRAWPLRCDRESAGGTRRCCSQELSPRRSWAPGAPSLPPTHPSAGLPPTPSTAGAGVVALAAAPPSPSRTPTERQAGPRGRSGGQRLIRRRATAGGSTRRCSGRTSPRPDSTAPRSSTSRRRCADTRAGCRGARCAAAGRSRASDC